MSSGGDHGTAGTARGQQSADYFLNKRSNASRASMAFRGAGAFTPGIACLPAFCPDTSRATVTRGEKREHSFAWSLMGMRTGMGLRH